MLSVKYVELKCQIFSIFKHSHYYHNFKVIKKENKPQIGFIHASYRTMLRSFPFNAESKNQHPSSIKLDASVNCNVANTVKMSVVVEMLAGSF